jgi:UDPglucose 6-dehydrogenase
MQNIVIAGYGFVGKAISKALSRHVNLSVVDPLYTSQKVYDFPDADGVIICVGTPTLPNGDCDVSQIIEVMKTVPERMPVLIKSTARPDLLEQIAHDFIGHDICVSPEFLRAHTAYEDFVHQQHMIIGGTYAHKWFDLFKSVLPECRTLHHCTIAEAATVKYSVNNFLATKVAFFNQIYDVCQANGSNFEVVRSLIALDPRIGESHTRVPGPDGTRGFGGVCFPKDTKSFVQYSTDLNTPVTIVRSAVEYNDKLTQKP